MCYVPVIKASTVNYKVRADLPISSDAREQKPLYYDVLYYPAFDSLLRDPNSQAT